MGGIGFTYSRFNDDLVGSLGCDNLDNTPDSWGAEKCGTIDVKDWHVYNFRLNNHSASFFIDQEPVVSHPLTAPISTPLRLFFDIAGGITGLIDYVKITRE